MIKKNNYFIIFISILILCIIIFIWLLVHNFYETNTYINKSEIYIPKELKDKPMSINVIIEDFKEGSEIPKKFTCEGENVNPKIKISNVPENAKSLAVIVYDPDAPNGIFYHWLLYNIPKNVTEIPEGLEKTEEVFIGLQGINDFRKVGYDGPCPPKAHGYHRYFFLVLALNTTIDKKSLKARDFINKYKDKIIAYGIYYGVYKRE